MPVKTLSKIVVLGAQAVGKTSIVEQIVYGNYVPEKEMHATVADSYDAWVDAERGQKERVRIYDLKGQDIENFVAPSHYMQISDGFILVFSVTSKKSFNVVEQLRKEISICRGKDFPVVVLGTKVDMSDARECNHAEVVKWAELEKVKLFEVLSESRATLQEPLIYLLKKMLPAVGKRNADMKQILFRRGPKGAKESSISSEI